MSEKCYTLTESQIEEIKAEARADCFNEALRFADQESYKEGFKRGIEQGKADGAKEFAEWLATKRGFSKEWVEWNIDHWQKGADE